VNYRGVFLPPCYQRALSNAKRVLTSLRRPARQP
jgi:hypothetical protein